MHYDDLARNESDRGELVLRRRRKESWLSELFD